MIRLTPGPMQPPTMLLCDVRDHRRRVIASGDVLAEHTTPKRIAVSGELQALRSGAAATFALYGTIGEVMTGEIGSGGMALTDVDIRQGQTVGAGMDITCEQPILWALMRAFRAEPEAS